MRARTLAACLPVNLSINVRGRGRGEGGGGQGEWAEGGKGRRTRAEKRKASRKSAREKLDLPNCAGMVDWKDPRQPASCSFPRPRWISRSKFFSSFFSAVGVCRFASVIEKCAQP